MANTVVVGAMWGDESKGKLIDYLAHDKDVVVRWGGGSNAGHTVVVDDQEYKLHLIPAGILHPETLCVVADGVVLDPASFVGEINHLQGRGVTCDNLKISGNAHVVLPYHNLLDELEEKRKGKNALGTTGRGIGPAYQDKAARTGIRMREFVDPDLFPARLTEALELKNELLTKIYGVPALKAEDIIAALTPHAEALRPYVDDTALRVAYAAKSGKKVLFEGAQATLLDIDLGTYPYVTSSHPSAGGSCIGTGLGPTQIDQIIAVSKSYTTRVGAGAFPTELENEIGDLIRDRGAEYGTTTGRPRRCGWLDGVALRYSSLVNGLTDLYVGHMDVLCGFEEVKIATAYELDGKTIQDFPSDQARLSRCKPIYQTLPGWKEDVSNVKTYEELPGNARRFIETIEALIDVPITMISVGRRRDQTLFRQP
ncbi:MAG: adenylosuccinate synthase [Capsulimonas sp.]|uniref:adenylosuccinate synthase n=1 Tax=Capsulimonas sp. TaxID=2494211 RepID=UPI003263A68F